MHITIECEKNELASNIGVAKALTEIFDDETDLKEIAEYLMVFAKALKEKKSKY